MESLEKALKQIKQDYDCDRTLGNHEPCIKIDEVLGLVGERADKIREIFEREAFYHSDKGMQQILKEVLALLVEAKK